MMKVRFSNSRSGTAGGTIGKWNPSRSPEQKHSYTGCAAGGNKTGRRNQIKIVERKICQFD